MYTLARKDRKASQAGQKQLEQPERVCISTLNCLNMDNPGFDKDSSALSDQKKANGEHRKKAASTISFHDIRHTVQIRVGKCRKTEKTILEGISGVFKPGMNAIMGPTGCGKTSLLDVLAARKDKSGLSGKVLVDGKPQPSNFRFISGYVVQDDVVMATLSVRENLTFSAALRLPSSVSKKEREQRVEDVISELGLQDCADTRIGGMSSRGVSGGERKRTNVGMELIIKPTILFLDEPTTGLDASTAGSVMSTMAQLSQRGRTIIFSIHQPRYGIFRLFDKLHLLSKGNTVYHGPAADALEYFAANGYVCEEHDNPADFFLDSILQNQAAIAASSSNAQDATEAIDLEKGSKSHTTSTEMTESHTSLSGIFKTSKHYTDMKREVDSIYEGLKRGDDVSAQEEVSYQTSFLTQLGHVTRRAFLNYTRNPKTSVRQYFLACLFSIIVGIIFFQLDDSADNAIQDRTGAFFFLTLNSMTMNMAAVDAFMSERVVFIHESISGYYRTSAYFIAKLIGDLIPQRTLPTFIYATIAYWMIGFKPDVVSYLIYTLNLLLATYAACGLYFLISTHVMELFSALAFISLSTIVQLMFAGFLINVESIVNWLSWLEYLSAVRYALKTFFINEFKGRVFCNAPPDNSTCVNGDKFLELQGIDGSTWGLWQNEVALACIALGFMTLAYIKLRTMKRFN